MWIEERVCGYEDISMGREDEREWDWVCEWVVTGTRGVSGWCEWTGEWVAGRDLDVAGESED